MEGSFKNCKVDEINLGVPIKKSQDQRIEDVAYWERKKKKEVIQEALDLYLSTKKDVPTKS